MQVRESILAVRDHLGQTKESLNRLEGAVTDTDGTVTLEFASPLPLAGSVIEARSSTNSELMYVWSVSGQVVTVQRGWGNTSGLAFSDEDPVAIDPVLPYAACWDAITDELTALPSEGLIDFATGAVTYSYTREGYDISSLTDLIRPLALESLVSGRDHWVYDFVEHDQLLRPFDYLTPDSGVTLYYARGFTQPTDHSSDLSTDCNVPASAQDIVGIGAAIRLVYSQEQLRGQANVQQHARSSEAVQPGSGVRSVSLLQQWKATRLAHEQRRQRERFPRRRM